MLRGLVLASDSDGSPAACVENINSRMGLEPLHQGLRLHQRLGVEQEGRDTPIMVTCESTASSAATPAAFAGKSSAPTCATLWSF